MMRLSADTNSARRAARGLEAVSVEPDPPLSLAPAEASDSGFEPHWADSPTFFEL